MDAVWSHAHQLKGWRLIDLRQKGGGNRVRKRAPCCIDSAGAAQLHCAMQA